MLVYDVEVLRGPEETEGGWNNPHGMGFGTAVVYDSDRDFYTFYGPKDQQACISDLRGNAVVSFNGIKFDNRVLLGNTYPWDDKPHMWIDYDILVKVVKGKHGFDSVEEAEKALGSRTIHDGSIGLNGLAQGTLGLGKTGHGAHAPKLIQAGDWPSVFAYNLNDVRLTWKLFSFGKKYGYLIDKKGNKIFIE